MDTDEHRLNAITEPVPGEAFAVSNELGCGFPEEVHKNALLHELKKPELKALSPCPINVLLCPSVFLCGYR